jgi:hypothetical protein
MYRLTITLWTILVLLAYTANASSWLDEQFAALPSPNIISESITDIDRIADDLKQKFNAQGIAGKDPLKNPNA